MTVLGIDLETYSPVDIKTCGVYRYAEQAEILLFGYAFDDDPVQCVDLANGEALPAEVRKAIFNPDVLKTAYNASFERVMLSHYFTDEAHMDGDPTQIWLEPDDWFCTMVHGLYLGLPGKLDMVGKVLFKDADQQKMNEGKSLINYFCKPCSPTKSNGGRRRNLPQHAPDKWGTFKAYNIRDVEVERNVRHKLDRFPVPDAERKLWHIDQEINDTGILIDADLVKQAIIVDGMYRKTLEAEAARITGLDNPNSVTQLKEWLNAEGVSIESLNKTNVKEFLSATDGTQKRVLELRQELAKTSVKKYMTLSRAVCADGRLHGVLQFYGANRTGRWAGRIFQPQNLPRITLKEHELDAARELVKACDLDALSILFDSPSSVLSQLIRTVIIPELGKKIVVCDLSAIESRTLAWLAGETWKLETFRRDGKIYEAIASRMFHIPIEEITDGSPWRQKGKIGELACGYGGSVGALKAFGADKDGMTEEDMKETVTAWRIACPHTVQFWWDIDSAAQTAVRERITTRVNQITFKTESGFLFITLPSGRRLAYARPRIETGKYDNNVISYEGIDTYTKKWSRIQTYGPRIVENIVQATARDILAEGIVNAHNNGLKIVLHVHDEIVCEMWSGDGGLEKLRSIMTTPPAWATGLPLGAKGEEADYYCK